MYNIYKLYRVYRVLLWSLSLGRKRRPCCHGSKIHNVVSKWKTIYTHILLYTLYSIWPVLGYHFSNAEVLKPSGNTSATFVKKSALKTRGSFVVPPRSALKTDPQWESYPTQSPHLLLTNPWSREICSRSGICWGVKTTRSPATRNRKKHISSNQENNIWTSQESCSTESETCIYIILYILRILLVLFYPSSVSHLRAGAPMHLHRWSSATRWAAQRWCPAIFGQSPRATVTTTGLLKV